MNTTFNDFASLVLAVSIEGTPFLLLGALVSALLAEVVPDGWLEANMPSGRFSGLASGLLAGMLLPTCECGVVPVVRRLLQKGLPSHSAIAYMLAAPVINPVVILSTWVAFRGDMHMVVGRVGVVAVTAGAVALGLYGVPPAELLLRRIRPAGPLLQRLDEMEPETHGPGCACGCHDAPPGMHPALRVARTTALEFLDMLRFLLFGALVAAAVRLYMPPGLLAGVQGSLPGSILALMAMAVILSVCSEADAFVAASFAAFPAAARLAFVCLGPMLDFKLIAMFLGSFQRRLVAVLVIAPAVLIFALSLSIGLSFGWARW